MQEAFNNYYVTNQFMVDMKEKFIDAASNSNGVIEISSAYKEKKHWV
ncbi:hypothetical protein SCORR_v1c09530 [Spiroplasma corruscae]|uniref:Uncharacterized protein n=1 Tax=Spiroplasma corruscae TaxID=216934 RepID=A0A222EQA1_9MOLU|nr:hypothetical protein [Spiroplasma corruscae]ASP28725.1 hypothetical protein SCORR_v1c09530 [Spiroplasma corruscae]